ncbi:MAG TPA: hypothetical protein VMT52_20500 [Planctomycetota bacterium]|nr:hypothetical protein [Planctomycetota bacterium]
MELLLAGLAGVALGALIASIIILHIFERRADRDLVERRLRACAEYRECLGNLESALEASNGDVRVVEQAWRNVGLFCREFRLTGWLLRPEARARLATAVDGLEREERVFRENGAGSPGRAAQVLCETYHEVDRILAREMEAHMREHQKPRFLPDLPGDAPVE